MAKYQWLVFIFIHEIIEYKMNTKEILNEISDNFFIVNENAVKLIVLVDEVKFDHVTRKISFEYNLMEFCKKQGTGKPQIVSINPEGIDLKSRNAWKQIFGFVYKEYSADRNILITWSHGNGFGINVEKPDDPQETIRVVNNSQFIVEKDQASEKADLLRRFGDNSFSDLNEFVIVPGEQMRKCRITNIVWMQDLANTLRDAIPGKRIDALLMVNCNMQTVDNAIILSDKVDYLVAPQSVSAYYGLNYKRIFSLLRRHPLIPNSLLVKNILQDYIEKYHYELNNGREILKEDSLFCNKLDDGHNLLVLINELSESLIEINKVRTKKDRLIDLRSTKLRDTSKLGLELIDLGLLLKLLEKEFGKEYPAFKNYVERYNEINLKMVIAKYIGSNYVLQDAYDNAKFGQSGLSIYFPTDKKTFENNLSVSCVYYNQPTMSQFAKLSLWDNFLTDLFA